MPRWQVVLASWKKLATCGRTAVRIWLAVVLVATPGTGGEVAGGIGRATALAAAGTATALGWLLSPTLALFVEAQTVSPFKGNPPTPQSTSAQSGVRPLVNVAFGNGDIFAGVGGGTIKHFSSSGALLDTLSTGVNNTYDTGMAFDNAGNLYASDFDGQQVSKFNNNGGLIGAFGSGYNSNPESVTLDGQGNVYVGQSDGTHQVLKFSPSGSLLATYSPAIQDRGTDWVDLAPDQCTLYYTSEGTLIKRFNVCTNTQLADFTTLPSSPAYALRIRPNGEVMVAATSAAYRLSTSGSVTQTYPRPSGETGTLFALNLDSDGTSFWTGGIETGNVYKINIATGAIEATFNSGIVTGLFGLAVSGEVTPGPPIQPPPPPAAGAGNYPPGLPSGGTSTDPVNTLSGTYSYTHTDMAIAGRGPFPTFVRAYNSTDTRSSPLGPGWVHNYSMHLASPGDGTSDLFLIGPQGRTDRYVAQTGGTFAPPSGVNTTLMANANGTYTATLVDQMQWTFDQRGRLTAITDRYGNASSVTYNGQGQLASVSDPAGRGALSFGYDSTSGLLTSVSDWSSRQIKYSYDTNTPPRLKTVTDRNNQVTTYAYDGTSSHLTSITDASGHVAVTMTYDSQGRVATQKDAQGLSTGQQTTLTYGAPDGQGNVTTTVTYPTTSFDGFAPQQVDTYNSASQITQRVSKPSSTETLTETYQYNAQGFRNQVTDARGNTTGFCYDVDYTGASIAGSLGNLTRTISPPPTSGANPLVTLVKYDSKNNVVETVAPNGVGSGAGVTCSTNLSGAVNGSGLFVTHMTYDATLGTELLSVTRKYTDPDQGAQTAVTKFEYGDATNPGLVTRIIPPRGNTSGTPDYTYATTLAYNTSGSQAGLLQSVTDPLGNKTTYTYDGVGRRTSLVDPNGNVSGGNAAAHTWSFTYDAEDRLQQASAPAPANGGAALTTSASFDAVGNRLTLTDANGQITRYQYDERDALKEVDQSATQNDPNGDAAKIRTLYSYDALGNLDRVDRAAGSSAEEVVDYAYDGLNRVRKEIQYPQGGWPSAPDGSTGAQTLITLTTYDPDSNRLTLTDPLNQLTTFGYDNLNRLTGISYSNPVPGTTTTANVTYAYDANGNRTSMADGTGNSTYSYDELDRLLSVASPATGTVGSRYDLDGNRTKLIYPDNTAATYTFNKASQLQSLLDWANHATGYTYFADGLLNTTTNADGSSSNFSYDNARRLTQVLNMQGASQNSEVISQHSYTLDAVGNRTHVNDAVPDLPSTTGTLGVSTIGSVEDSADANYLAGSQVTVGSQPVTVASMSTFIGAVDAAPHNQFAFAIYTDNNGVPGTLVAQSQVSTLSANALNTLPISASLQANTKYWLLYDTNSSNANDNNMFYTPVGGNLGAYAAQPFGTPFPTTITGAGNLPWQFSIYATLSSGTGMSGTLGLSTIGSTLDSEDANYLAGSQVTVGAQPVTVASMSTFIGPVDAAPHNQYAFAIYTDNNGVPGTLVAQSQVGTLSANTLNTLPISASLQANTKYWLLYDTNSSNGNDNDMFYTPVGSNLGAYAAQPFGTPLPTTITGAGNLPWQFSIYATLNRGGTLGLTSLGTTLDTGEADHLTGSQVTVGSQAASVASISTYVGAVDTAPHNQYAFAIYTDNNGAPANLVAQTQVGTLTPNALNTLPISASLQANTKYWLLYDTNSTSAADNDMFYTAASTNLTASVSQLFGNPFPPTISGAATSPRQFSIYATLASAGALDPADTLLADANDETLGGLSPDHVSDQVAASTAGPVAMMAPVAQTAQPAVAQPNPKPHPSIIAPPPVPDVARLVDQSADAGQSYERRAETPAYAAQLFGKTSGRADVLVQHKASGVQLGFALQGTPLRRTTSSTEAVAVKDTYTVHWTVQANRLKEDIVLGGRPSSNQITFDVQSKGLSIRSDGAGGYWAVDGQQVNRFHMPAPTVLDAKGKKGRATLTISGTTATVQVDAGFLSTATYPVTVDPSVIFTTDYGYDHLYRLTCVNPDSNPGTCSTGSQTQYTYDPLGNRLSLTRNNQTTNYTYDKADRILTAGSTNFTVNAAGNQTARGSDTFSYDQANRLTSSTVANLGATSAYDGDGKRISHTVWDDTTHYAYDVGGGLPVLVDDGTRKYVWGAGGLAYSVDKNGGALAVYHTDGLGSVRAITNGDGDVIQTYQTDEFGVPTAIQGASTQPFGFTGEQVDAASSLSYLRARMYDPATGRFLQRDQLMGIRYNPTTLHRFTYARSNPVHFLDPSGTTAINEAQALCVLQGWDCENMTHDMAVELINGNAVDIDVFDPSVLVNGSPIDQLVFVALAASTGGTASIERTATTEFGRAVLSLRSYLGSGEGAWRLLSAHGEAATSVVYRGATSIEQVFLNPETGERVVRHIIVRGDEILHETFRSFSKFGAS